MCKLCRSIKYKRKNLNLASFIVFRFVNRFIHLKACSQAGEFKLVIPSFFNSVLGLQFCWQYLSVFLWTGKWNLSTALASPANSFVTSFWSACLGFSACGLRWHISSKSQSLNFDLSSGVRFPRNSMMLPCTWLMDSHEKSSSIWGMRPQRDAEIRIPAVCLLSLLSLTYEKHSIW